MRWVSLLVIVSLVSAGCSAGVSNPNSSSNVTLPAFVLNAPASGIDAFTSAAPSALLGGAAVLPLFELPNIPTNQGQLRLTMWGLKNSSGTITQVTQAQVTGMGVPPGSVHVFFNAASQPVLFRDDASGYSVAISNAANIQTVTLCDPQNVAQAYVVLTIPGGVAQGSSAIAGGSCALTLAATAPVVSAGALSTPVPSGVATNVSSLAGLAQLITVGSYVAGFGFALGAIMKFKAHKDNPTQVPLSAPIGLIFFSAALIFAPALFKSAGGTLFDDGTLVPGVDGITPFYMSAP